MNEVSATYREGRVQLDHSVDWPEGSRIEVRLVSGNDVRRQGDNIRPEFRSALANRNGLDDNLWPLSPDETALLLQDMDAAEPLDLSLAEQQAIEAKRLEDKRLQTELVRQQWIVEQSS